MTLKSKPAGGAAPASRDATITKVRHQPAELYAMAQTGSLTRQAAEEGISLTALLERMNPTDEQPESERGADAFGRVLRAAKIRTVSNPSAGMYADQAEVFFKPENRALFLEWAQRRWREARFGVAANAASARQYATPNGPLEQTRQTWTSADEGLGSTWRPYVDLAGERASQIAPAIPLSLLVSRTTPVTGDAVRMSYMVEPTAEQLRMYRVGETAEIPLARYVKAENEVRLFKYGRGIEISYEAMRRDPIDRIAFWIQRQAIQNENDKVAHALDVIINGDGNTNSATNHDKTDMQGGVSGDALTLKGWLTFLAQFSPNYNPTIAFAHLDDYVTILSLTAGNAYTPAAATGYVGGVSQVQPLASQIVNLARLEALPANIVLGVDSRFSLEYLTEIGSNIQESDRFITRQTEVMVMTETDGFDIIDQKAARTLTMNA